MCFWAKGAFESGQERSETRAQQKTGRGHKTLERARKKKRGAGTGRQIEMRDVGRKWKELFGNGKEDEADAIRPFTCT